MNTDNQTNKQIKMTIGALILAGGQNSRMDGRISGQGPLGGLSTALSVCRSDALVVCACDMPFVTAELTAYLAEQARLHPEARAIAIRDRSGRLHPLCGVYRKEAGGMIHDALMQDERRMIRVFRELQGKELSLAETEFPDRLLSNVNTPEEMASLL